MKDDCISYGDCRLPVMTCNGFCRFYNKTCMNCVQREGEECEKDGHEIYDDSMPCEDFEDFEE